MSQKKRTHKSLTIKDKQNILAEVDKKVRSKSEICRIYGIPPSTLSGYLKNRDKIEKSLNLKSKKLRPPMYEALEQAVHSWIKQALVKSVTVTRQIILEKAKEMAREMNIFNFLPKNGWYYCFKKRYGLSDLISQEDRPWKADVDASLLRVMRNFDHKNIFIVSVTGLMFGFLPSKVCALKDEKCSQTQLARNRLTLLVAMNLDGSEKLPLLVIGKFKNSSCFKHCDHLPLTYVANSNSWMTEDIFELWVHELESNFKRENRKVCLVLRDYHAPVNLLTGLTIVQHPSTETTVVQPLLNDMVSTLKQHYRKLVIEKLIVYADEGKHTSQFDQTTLDTMYDLKTAWNRVSGTDLVNKFRHDDFSSQEQSNLTNSVGQTSDEDEEQISIFERRAVGFLPEGITLEQYLSLDETICTSLETNSQHIMADSDLEEEESESDTETNPPPSVADAREAIATLRQYYQTQFGSRTGKFVETLIKISSQMDKDTVDKARAKRSKPRQTTIQDFFKL